MLKLFLLLAFITVVAVSTDVRSAETKTVSSTVVTDKSVPTASAPSVVVNNSDVCKVATSGAIQTNILGLATGVVVDDTLCQLLKLSRQLYASGLKVAAISLLAQEDRKSTRLNSSHGYSSYAVFCLKKKKLTCFSALIM